MLDATVRLQPRDRVLTMLLDEHRTLSTHQVAAVLFTSPATCRNRLYRLRQGDWLDRFVPIGASAGSGTHWVLGNLGLQWAAGQEKRPPPSPKTGRDQRRAIATNPHGKHDDGARQVFIDLLVHARHHPGARLARWWSPKRTAESAGQRLHPDGHGVWEEHDPDTGRTVQVGFYLEYDTGTEHLAILMQKIKGYERYRESGPDYPLLLFLHSPMREANLHRKLNGRAAHLTITLATTTPVAAASDPDHLAGAVWKIAGNGRLRHRLADLPSHHGEPGTPYHPGPPTPEQDPLRGLGVLPG